MKYLLTPEQRAEMSRVFGENYEDIDIPTIWRDELPTREEILDDHIMGEIMEDERAEEIEDQQYRWGEPEEW